MINKSQKTFLILSSLLLSFIDTIGQRSRDFGRNYSDTKSLNYSADQTLMSFAVSVILFTVGYLINKYYVNEKGESKSFIGVILIWISFICFIPAFQFLLSLGVLILIVFIIIFVLFMLFSGIIGKTKK